MSIYYKNYIYFVSFITFILMSALFISILGWMIGGCISLGFSLFIFLLIWNYIKNNQPVKLESKTISLSPQDDQLRILIKGSCEKLDFPWLKIVLIHFFILSFLNVNFFWVAPDNVSKIIIPFNVFYIFLSAGVTWLKVMPFIKLKRLIGAKERILILNSVGIHIPVELVNHSAFEIALKNKQTEISFKWSILESCKIYNQVGRSRPQILFEFKENYQYADLMGNLSLFRTQEIDYHLCDIQNLVTFHLSKRPD